MNNFHFARYVMFLQSPFPRWKSWLSFSFYISFTNMSIDCAVYYPNIVNINIKIGELLY